MNGPVESVVVTQDLCRSFSGKTALNNIDLEIRAGEVFGLVGENGAGKTTLIRHLLGLLKPTTGTVSVFGLDPVKQPENVLANIGYVSEDRDLPDWLKVGEFFRFTKAFYQDWDDAYEMELVDAFSIDLRASIKSLSRGERARVCLVSALAYRPALLLLDEPSSGLDPVVRQDVLSAVIKTVSDDGRTVIFSSHLLDEIQRVADRVCMIDKGNKMLDLPVEQIFETHFSYSVRFPVEFHSAPRMDGVYFGEGFARDWKLVTSNPPAVMAQILERQNAEIVDQRQPSLDEIFVARCRSSNQSRKLKSSPKKAGADV